MKQVDQSSKLGWEPTSLDEIGTCSGALGVEERTVWESSCLTVADLNLFQDNVIASELLGHNSN